MKSLDESSRTCLALHLLQNQHMIYYCPLKSDLPKKQGKNREKNLNVVAHPDK